MEIISQTKSSSESVLKKKFYVSIHKICLKFTIFDKKWTPFVTFTTTLYLKNNKKIIKQTANI